MADPHVTLYDGCVVHKSSIFSNMLGDLEELICRIQILAMHDPDHADVYDSYCTEIQHIGNHVTTMDTTMRKPFSYVCSRNTVPDIPEHLYPYMRQCYVQARKLERRLWKIHESTDLIVAYRGCNEQIIHMCDVHVDKAIFAYLNELSTYVLSGFVVV